MVCVCVGGGGGGGGVGGFVHLTKALDILISIPKKVSIGTKGNHLEGEGWYEDREGEYRILRTEIKSSVYRDTTSVIDLSSMSLVVRKPVFGVSDLVQHKSGSTATENC